MPRGKGSGNNDKRKNHRTKTPKGHTPYWALPLSVRQVLDVLYPEAAAKAKRGGYDDN